MQHTPKHRLIIDSIEHQVRTGRLKPGSRVPSLTQLQRLYGVSYGTVRAATMILKATGVIRGEAGVGMYVASGADSAA